MSTSKTAEPSARKHVEGPDPDSQAFSSVRAIYFDLDDTLCGYWDACKEGIRRTFEKHGPKHIPVEESIQHWAAAFREFSPTLKKTGWYETYLKNGEPTRTEQMRLTLQRMGIDDQDLARDLSQTYLEERDRCLELFPHAETVLKNLYGRYPLGLITNGPADIQRMEIATLNIEKYFQHIFIEGEQGEGKPLASVFERAARAVGLTPDQLLFVGNSFAHDMAPAIQFGWRTIWVRRESDVPPSAGPEAAKPEEPPKGATMPDAIIHDLDELLRLLP
jgi:putative hydrolase of the HAD superfamily